MTSELKHVIQILQYHGWAFYSATGTVSRVSKILWYFCFGLLVTSTTKPVLRGSILIFSICYQIQFHFQFSSCHVFQISVFFFVHAPFAFDTMCAEFS